MAYVPNQAQQTPDEEQNKFGLTSPTTPNPVPPQSGGSAGTSQSGGGAAPGVGTSTQFGSNATKLSDYLTANADQAENFGNQVAGNLNQGYQQAQGAIDTGFGNFNNQVGGSYTPPNSDVTNRAAADPTGFAKDPNNVSQFKSLYNDTYTGPNNFESTQPYSDINNQVNQAVSNAGLTKTQAGLGTYLNNSMGAKDTTQGMQTLDSALLTGNANSAKAIKNAAAPYSGLNDYLSGKTSLADANAVNSKKIADQTRTETQNQFTGPGGVIPKFQADVNNRYNQAVSGGQASFDKIKADLASGKLTPEEISQLGLTPEQAQSFTNNQQVFSANNIQFDPTSYLTNNTANITPENFATQADYDKANALNQLTGQDMGFLNKGNSAQAGTAGSPYSFNASGANQTLSDLLKGIPPDTTPGQPNAPTGNNNDLLGVVQKPSEIKDPLAVINPGWEVPPAVADVGSGLIDAGKSDTTGGLINQFKDTLSPVTTPLSSPAGNLANVVMPGINPLPALNKIGDLGNKMWGAGKTANGQEIANQSTQLQTQLTQLRGAKDQFQKGQMTPQQYQDLIRPVVSAVGQRVQQLTGMGSAWASAIMPTWNAFINDGFVTAKNGNWVLGSGPNAPVLWSPSTNQWS